MPPTKDENKRDLNKRFIHVKRSDFNNVMVFKNENTT